MKFTDLPLPARTFWAKSGDPHGHSLIAHMLDIAAVAESILEREPPKTMAWAGQCFGLEENQVGRWLASMAGLHDLGKSIPGFQDKWPEGRRQMEASGLTFLPRLLEKNRHDLATVELFKRAVTHPQCGQAWMSPTAMAIGAHHGFFTPLSQCKRAVPNAESEEWIEARQALFSAYWQTMDPPTPTSDDISLPCTTWLAGLTSVSDWIGSNTEWFPMGERGETLRDHFAEARNLAGRALDEIGWPTWTPLLRSGGSTSDLLNRMVGRTGLAARPLQIAADELIEQAQGPSLMIVEAPMGEGKTELAFLTHLRLQALNQHRGLYVALPTQATGNALFDRALTFLKAFSPGARLDIQLVHGGAALDERIHRLRGIGGMDLTESESVSSSMWFSARKRPLLSPYGVGTIDQALLGSLNVKHHFVRLWGLANRVVVLDEVHAYDTYTGGLIESLLRWLRGLNCSVILMSATLPNQRRASLLEAWGVKAVPDLPYPRVLLASGGKVSGRHVACRELAPIRVEALPEDLEHLADAALKSLSGGGCGAIILNTVSRTQELYTLLKGRVEPGVKLLLFHARFPADDRSTIEQDVLNTFGRDEGGRRPEKALLVASQVAEQSLDIDFDFLLSDLAPIDLLLQRAGRLHRHIRPRPTAHTHPVIWIAGLQKDRLPELKKTAWGYVYDPYILYKTHRIASNEPLWHLPEDIDRLVQAVYSGDPFEGDDREEILRTLDFAFGEHLAKEQEARKKALNAALDADAEPLFAFDRLQLADEDEGENRLLAATRLGEASCTVVPVHVAHDGWRLFPSDPPFDPQIPIADDLARRIYGRQVRLGRQGLVQNLLATEPPMAFQKHPLLRNLHPLCLEDGLAIIDAHRIRLDPELGITYPPKEGT